MHVAMLHFPLYLLQLVFSPLKIVTQKGSAVKSFCIAAWYVSVTKPTFFKSLYQFPDKQVICWWQPNLVETREVKVFVLKTAQKTFRVTEASKHYLIIWLNLKSVNLQYNTLGCWFVWTNEPATKRLMFQAIFFFIISYRLRVLKLFIFIFVKL